MTLIDEYMAKLPEGQALALARIRNIVKGVFPNAEETVSYGMPTIKVDGKPVILFSAFKNHMSIFGNVEDFHDELKEFKMSGRGTLQFTEDHQVPEEIIKKLAKARAEQYSK